MTKHRAGAKVRGFFNILEAIDDHKYWVNSLNRWIKHANDQLKFDEGGFNLEKDVKLAIQHAKQSLNELIYYTDFGKIAKELGLM